MIAGYNAGDVDIPYTANMLTAGSRVSWPITTYGIYTFDR